MPSGRAVPGLEQYNKLLLTIFPSYKSKVLQEKNGTLTVKLRKRGAAGRKEGKDAFKTIGGVPLSLHDLSDCHQEPFTETLDWCVVEDAKLEFVVTARESVEVGNFRHDLST